MADSDIYILDHLLFLIGTLMLVGGLVALQRSITGERGAAFARYGYVVALLSTGLLAVLTGIDGRASKVIFDAWAAAPAADADTLMMIAEATEELNFGMFSVWIMLFFGITYILYGLAVSTSDNYPKWLGWAAVALGAVSFVVGAIVNLDGPSELLVGFIFSGVASLLVFWTLAMGVLMWRKAA